MLIFTEGDLYPTDFEKFIDELVDCRDLPISVIMIGIGDNSFDFITWLLPQSDILFSGTHKAIAERNIFSFVKYKDEKENKRFTDKLLDRFPK